jgi:hypothetical protein
VFSFFFLAFLQTLKFIHFICYVILAQNLSRFCINCIRFIDDRWSKPPTLRPSHSVANLKRRSQQNASNSNEQPDSKLPEKEEKKSEKKSLMQKANKFFEHIIYPLSNRQQQQQQQQQQEEEQEANDNRPSERRPVFGSLTTNEQNAQILNGMYQLATF